MFELVAIWFGILISLIVIVKRVEKPQTEMAKNIHTKAHRYG